jgi:hypothetical protein
MRVSTGSVGEFAKHFAKTLERRLYPYTPLRPKQLAAAVGYSYDALMAWLRGESRVPGEVIANLSSFFRERGDGWFVVELFGSQSEIEAAKLRTEMAEIQSRLDAMAAVMGSQNAATTGSGTRLVDVAATPAAGRTVAAEGGTLVPGLAGEHPAPSPVAPLVRRLAR